MKRAPALPWVIDILDDGLRLYRRYWSRFVLATTALVVPLSLCTFILNALVTTQLGQGWALLATLVIALVGIPFSSYTVAVLSRMAAVAAGGQSPTLLAALRMPIRRVIGMGCYTVTLTFLSTLCFGGAGFVFLCVIIALAARLVRRPLFGVSLGPLFAVTLGLGFFGYLLLCSAIAMSAIYAVQVFALDRESFGTSLTRSSDFLFYRFFRNVLCFIMGGAIFATVVTAYTGTLSFAVAALAQYFFRTSIVFQGLVGQAILTTTTVVSAVVLMPPMPIWVALLYLRVRAEREGSVLEQRINTWVATTAPELPVSVPTIQ